jgi:ribosomal protein S12 methylthiotransferase accessory factor
MTLQRTGLSNYRGVGEGAGIQPYVSGLANVTSELRVTSSEADEPELIIASASFRRTRLDGSIANTTGHGVGCDVDSATIRAIAEAIERHASTVFYEEQFVWASALQLKGRALDLDSIPTCSHEERKNPNCPLGLPRKDKPIRWVKGLSLHDGEPIWVPAVMVYLQIGWREEQERFWLPISTGCAAGPSYGAALLNALCEVVERDSVVLTWMQELQWPRITIDDPGPITRPLWRRCQECTGDIEYHFFNSTTDINLPIIYGVQISRHHPRAHTIVASSTALSFDEALAKTIKDLIAFKRAFILERSTSSAPHLL